MANEDRGAVLIDDHRYSLWRVWARNKGLVMFIGLNPSTANGIKDDPTIHKVRAYVKSWGYGGFYMMNLFTIVSSDPKVLLTCEKPIGAHCEYYLRENARVCDKVIFAWGAFKVNGRDKQIIEMFPDAYCLGKNSDGSPFHPMYKNPNLKPIKYGKND